MTEVLNETPTLAKVLEDTFESRLTNLHTCLPGRVTKYNHETQSASIQLDLRRVYRDGSEIEIPVIGSVPVAWPRARGAFLHFPLRPGDVVTVVFSERSLDEWKEQGGLTTPKESRKHDYSDAIAIPGGYPFSKPAKVPDNENAWLINEKSKIKLTPKGTFEVTGRGEEELFQILYETLDLIQEMTTNTIFGPMRVNEHPQFQLLRDRLDRLREGG